MFLKCCRDNITPKIILAPQEKYCSHKLSLIGNYAFFGFAVAIILLSLATQLTTIANIIRFSFYSLLSFQFSYFITLISAFSIPLYLLSILFFPLSLLVEKRGNSSYIFVFFFFLGDIDIFKFFLY